jgi:NDP-sugar pyrophosphorylase family protein
MRAQIVIPMSGIGARFQAKGYGMPKPLIPVAGKPIIAHVLDMYPNDLDFVFIVNEHHLHNKEFHLKEVLLSLRPDARIVEIAPHKTGPSGAIALAESQIDRDLPTIVNYCDFTCTWDYEQFYSLLNDSDGVIATYSGFHPHMVRSTKFAYVSGEGNHVNAIQEKQPYTSNPMSERASSGTYGFSSGGLMLDAIHRQIERKIDLAGEFYTSLTYVPLLEDGLDIRSFNIECFFQWGTPEDLKDFLQVYESFESMGRKSTEIESNNSTVLLAAGNGARFSNAGYTTPKASLPLSGKPAWLQVLNTVRGTGKAVTVCRGSVIDTTLASSHSEVIELNSVTQGQAESARIGIERISAKNEPVVIASCDALFPAGHVNNLIGMNTDLVVWVCNSTAKSDLFPEQFSWVKVDQNFRVIDLRLKANPSKDGNWFVMSGTFTFKDTEIANSYISEIIDRDIRVNGEFYVDSAVQIAIERGEIVMADLRSDFIGLGTPEEYETFHYWQRTFHKWASSTYDFGKDPMMENGLSPREGTAVSNEVQNRIN